MMKQTYYDSWAEAQADGTAVAYAGNTAGNTRNGRIDYHLLLARRGEPDAEELPGVRHARLERRHAVRSQAADVDLHREIAGIGSTAGAGSLSDSAPATPFA